MELKELGHHFTWNFLKDLHNKASLSNIEIRLRKELDAEPYARRHAIMNLLGFMEVVGLKKLKAGQEIFETVLKEDDKNYNALQNLCTVYEKLGQEEHETVRQCKKTIVLLEDLNGEEIQSKIIKARAYHEKATAMSYTDQCYLHKDHEIAEKYFSKAISLGEHVLGIHELNEWRFGFGFLYQKMDTLYHVQETKYFKKGMHLFYSIACSDVQHVEQDNTRAGLNVEEYHKMMKFRQLDIKAKAWAFMGVLMRRHTDYKTLSSILESDTLQPEHGNLDDMQCCLKAVELTPNSVTVIRRLAQGYMKHGLLDEAFEFFKKADDLMPNDGYTYYQMGRLFMEKYKKSNPHDHELLDKAINYYKLGLENQCDLTFLFSNLAEAYKHKGDLLQALEICYQGSIAPGGDRDIFLYEVWASILSEMGDEEGAKGKKKFAEILKMRIKAEKCDFGVIFSSEDSEIVITAVHEIEEKYDVKGYYFQRDCPLGISIFEEYKEIEENCRIIMMFVSNNFCKSSFCKKEMSEILQMRLQKDLEDTITPVLIRNFDFNSLPPGLKSHHGVQYPSAEFFPKISRLFHNFNKSA